MRNIKISLSFIYLINLLLGFCFAEINPNGFMFGTSNPLNPITTLEPQQCPVTLGTPTDGLKARFYRYVYAEDTPNILDEDFLDHEYYIGDRYLGEVDGVYDVSFNFFYGTQTGVISQGQINGFNLTISNFSVEYTGWFVPETSGKYTFQIGQTDDGTLLEMFGSNEVLCCDSVPTESFALYSIQYYDNTTVHTGTMEMTAGESYPFRIVFFNRDAVAIQTISFIDPDGVVHKDFTGYAKYYNDLECPSNDDILDPSSSIDVAATTVSAPVTTITASFTMTQTPETVTTVETVSVPNETINITTTEIITFSTETSTATIVTTTAVPTESTSLLTITDVVTEDGSLTTITEIITLAPPPFVNETIVTTSYMTESKGISVSTSIVVLTETKPVDCGSQNPGEFNSVTEYATFTTTIYSLVTVYPSNSIGVSSIESLSVITSSTNVGGEIATSVNNNGYENGNMKTEITTNTVVNGNTYINGCKVSTATVVNENNVVSSDKVIMTNAVNGNNNINSGTVGGTVGTSFPTVVPVVSDSNTIGNNPSVAPSRRSTLAAVGRLGSSTKGVIVNNNEGNYMFNSNIFLMFLMLVAL